MKKLISLLLALIFAAGLVSALPVTAGASDLPPTKIIQVTWNEDYSVTFTTDNTAIAREYWLGIFRVSDGKKCVSHVLTAKNASFNGNQVTATAESTQTSLSLLEESGDYCVGIWFDGEKDSTRISSAPRSITVAKLDPPSNPRWEGTTAVWDADPHAVAYFVWVYDKTAGKQITFISGLSEPRVDLSQYMTTGKDYSFEVAVIGPSSEYGESDPAEGPVITAPETHSITVDGGSADKRYAAKGEKVTVTAEERENYSVTWNLVSGGVTLADPNAAETTFVMGDQNVSLKANYKYSGPVLTDFYVYVTPPAAGEHPQAPTVKSGDYEVSAYTWIKITGEVAAKMTAGDVFEEGSGILYQCRVDLKATAYQVDEPENLNGYVNDAAKNDDGTDVTISRSSFEKVKIVGSFNCAPALTNPFVDVSGSDQWYDAVLWAYYAKPQVTNGMDADHFGPKLTVTRGQCAAFLWRAMGEPEPASTNNPFVDVPSWQYYYKPILWAVEKGITKGTDATHYSPDQTLSTAHIVTFLYRTLGIGADGWYQDAALWAGGAGLLKDLSLTVDPGVDCPRANVVLFLYRALK